METQWTRMTANEAAEIIQHNDMVAFSGFTPAGSPKALPTAIARRANEQHEAKKPYQIRLLTGASISAAADDVFLTPMLFPGVRHIKHRPVYVKRSIRAR